MPMNNTFRQVAALCGLRLSYYTMAVLLSVSFLCLVVTEYRTPSPLYILLALATLPSLMKSIFFTKKEEKPLTFPLFCKKYRYSSRQYHAMSIAYLLLFVLLAAWHISYGNADTLPVPVSILQSLIAGISLTIRILGVIGYQVYFHLFPLKSMR